MARRSYIGHLTGRMVGEISLGLIMLGVILGIVGAYYGWFVAATTYTVDYQYVAYAGAALFVIGWLLEAADVTHLTR